ncbi:CD226 protein, partial [Oreocharis arfaki]|nr:CD226 protein [Oreocharis arfaki]
FADSSAKLAEKVKLQCMCPKKKAVIIQTSWMKLNVTHKENTAVLHPVHGIHTKDKYNRRIYFENRDKSLSFIKSSLEDKAGFCWVLCFSTDSFEVSEKQNNPMFTKSRGNVAFTCPYKIGDSVQRAKWERIKANWVDIVIPCNLSGKQSFGSDFKERTPVDCSDQENSRIVFQNITASDFAMYCRAAPGRKKTNVMSFTV